MLIMQMVGLVLRLSVLAVDMYHVVCVTFVIYCEGFAIFKRKLHCYCEGICLCLHVFTNTFDCICVCWGIKT